MRRLRFYIITLLAVVCFLVLLSYFLIQTTFVARLASQQLSKFTPYTISVGSMHHSMTNFYEVVFEDVVISDENQEIVSIPKLIIGLDQDNVWQLNHFNYITIVNGVINDTSKKNYDISANLLNFVDSTVNLSVNDGGEDKFSFQQINGAIKPFALAKQDKYHFDLTSQQVLFNQISVQSVLIQGFYQDGVTSITNVGGNINNGFFVGKLKILADNSLDFDQLKINNVHFQLNDDKDIKQLPTFFSNFTIHQLSMFDSTIQLPYMSIEKGNLEATNINYNKQWDFDQSSLVFNAENVVWNNEVFSSVLLQLKSQDDIVTIEKALASWREGSFNFSGTWQDNLLKVDQLTFSNVNYKIPEKIEPLILPDIFNRVEIDKLTILPSLILRTNRDYPFALTNFQVSGSDVIIVQDKKLGLYSGSIFFKAERASINMIDIKYPDLIVNFDSQGRALLSFSTLISGGMVESTAIINPSQTEFLSLKLTAYNITSLLLNEWKLVNQPPKAINYTADLHGDIAPFAFSGTFSADGNDYVISGEH